MMNQQMNKNNKFKPMNIFKKNYKKQLLFVLAICMGLTSYAQKDELKAADKALKGGDVAAAKTAIDQAEGLIASADDKLKAKFYFLKAKTYYDVGKKNPSLDAKAYDKAAKTFQELLDFEKKIGKAKYTEEAKPMLSALVADVSNKGIQEYQNKDYAKAKASLYQTYLLSKKDTTFLEYAANAAYLDQDFDLALTHFETLRDLNYSGITTRYSALSKSSGEREDFSSKEQMDLMVKSGQYSDPKAVKSESKKGDIIKNIALLLVEKGETEKAMEAVSSARKLYPNDLNLILTEANVLLKLGDKPGFKRAMEEAIAQDPKNPNLYFNVGVINQEQGDIEAALKNYDKAIELDPKYVDAYLNKGAAMLEADKKLVDEMNENLNNFKKYDEIKAKQVALYKEVIPFYKKAYDLSPENMDIVRTLMSMYENVEMEDEFKAMKAIYDASKG